VERKICNNKFDTIGHLAEELKHRSGTSAMQNRVVCKVELLARGVGGGKRAATGEVADMPTGDKDSSLRTLRNSIGTDMLILAGNPLLQASFQRLQVATQKIAEAPDTVIDTTLATMQLEDLLKLQTAMISQSKPKARYSVFTKFVWQLDSEIILTMAEHLKVLKHSIECMSMLALQTEFAEDNGTMSWENFHKALASAIKTKTEQRVGRD
jgi:hypothetical protein